MLGVWKLTNNYAVVSDIVQGWPWLIVKVNDTCALHIAPIWWKAEQGNLKIPQSVEVLFSGHKIVLCNLLSLWCNPDLAPRSLTLELCASFQYDEHLWQVTWKSLQVTEQTQIGNKQSDWQTSWAKPLRLLLVWGQTEWAIQLHELLCAFSNKADERKYSSQSRRPCWRSFLPTVDYSQFNY